LASLGLVFWRTWTHPFLFWKFPEVITVANDGYCFARL